MLRFTTVFLIYLPYFFHSPNSFTISNDQIVQSIVTLDNIAIDFSQIDTSYSSESEGTIIIKKPYNFRVNYYNNIPFLLIGNKSEIALYDYELKQTTRISPDQTNFNIFLLNAENFKKSFTTTKVNYKSDSISAELKHIDTGKIITLIFNTKLELQKITIKEYGANQISISIKKIYNCKYIDNSLFGIRNPDVFGPPQKLSHDRLFTHLQLSD
jgi:outer membrane lipoprotein-sorting protein